MTQKPNEPIELYEPFESESAVIFFFYVGSCLGSNPVVLRDYSHHSMTQNTTKKKKAVFMNLNLNLQFKNNGERAWGGCQA